MKLFAKIFLCAMTVLSIALSVSGYLLISSSFDNAMKREKERVLDRYQLVKFSIQASMLTSDIDWEDGEEIAGLSVFENMYAIDDSNQIGIFTEEKEIAYSVLPVTIDTDVLEEVSDDYMVYSNHASGLKYYILVSGKVTQGKNSVYLAVSTDISDIVQDKYRMESTYKTVFGATLGGSMAVLLLLSTLITRPIKKLTKATAKIAKGNYGERTRIRSADEIGELGARFDHMAEVVDDKIQELERNARQKEEFVANFAHELKTPLTSIIGYSDMIYQKELSPQGAKNAAGYILKEGLRLEALSLKLMDLIVLNRQEFILEELHTTELFEDLSHTLLPQMEKKGIELMVKVDPAYIRVEYDLFKTMLLNFVDNAVKADSTKISVFGSEEENKYYIQVQDNGRGMPEAELERITEAFYMVDKSRARRQHGAGLGLALASRIVEIHKGEILFESGPGEGTTVSVILEQKEGIQDDQTEYHDI